MTFDYKKEYKEFYMPKGTPSIVTVPKMNYIAVRGSGNPNDADGEYKQAIGLLYGIAFTIKMSKKEDHQIDGYFDYVVPPLEGFWWQGERRPGDAMLRTDRAGRRDGVSVFIDFISVYTVVLSCRSISFNRKGNNSFVNNCVYFHYKMIIVPEQNSNIPLLMPCCFLLSSHQL
jgi:hypothetical protein